MPRPSNKPRTTFDDLLAPPDLKYSPKKAALFSPALRQRSVVILAALTVLFAAAFIALLVLHFSQKKDYEGRIAELEDSFRIVRENSEAMRQDNEARESQIAVLEGKYENCMQFLYQSTYLWELEIRFQMEDYEGCAALLTWLSKAIPELINLYQTNRGGYHPPEPFINNYEHLIYIEEELITMGYLEDMIYFESSPHPFLAIRYPDHIECKDEWTQADLEYPNVP